MTSSYQQRRRQLITLIHIARGQLGMSEDAYRANLAHYGSGKTSAKDMSVPELETVLSTFKDMGFKVKRKRTSLTSGNWRKPRLAKLNAMWIMLADNGHVRDRSEAAMQSWCIGQIKGLEKLEWADSIQLNQCIEKLKMWCARVGLDEEINEHE